MKIIKRIAIWLVGICAVLYLLICIYFYSAQEKLIFPAEKLEAGYKFNFAVPFKEYQIKCAAGDTLDGILFKATHPKGLVFYLHGNGDNMKTFGPSVADYTRFGYDTFMLDYPGYGKSTGHISSLSRLFTDIQTAYDTLKAAYPESRIVMMGYSIGSGMAAWLASHNHPAKLVLIAPYYSLTDLAFKTHAYLPHFILKYPINTYLYVQQVKAPITIFHGDEDEIIYYGSSLKLKPYLKRGDTLITLHGQGHLHFNRNAAYEADMAKILDGE